MNTFFRFPQTPHLAWLGEGQPRGDKVLSAGEVSALLEGDVVVEEKVDGANLGLSRGPDGTLRVQNRGQYLEKPFSGQFARLASWLPPREDALRGVLGENLILFGEWCAARHSLDYSGLPDWFLAFDVYDRSEGRFWSTARRNGLAAEAGLPTVPEIYRGRASVAHLEELVRRERSRFRSGPLEGVIVRRESADWLESRAKLVYPEFTQSIAEHWRRRGLEWNRLAGFSWSL